jgi:hypothetical protein
VLVVWAGGGGGVRSDDLGEPMAWCSACSARFDSAVRFEAAVSYGKLLASYQSLYSF